MIQLFVVAGAYGFALFENRETQTRWRAFADLAFVRVIFSFLSLEIRLNHPVVFHVKHGLLFYEASKWMACST